MPVPFISNLGFTTVDTAGTLNTEAGAKDALPVQYYKLIGDIEGQLVINNNANHAKIILDMNNRTLVGADGSSSAVSPIQYNGTGTVELKGGGLITGGGQSSITATGTGNATDIAGISGLNVTASDANGPHYYRAGHTSGQKYFTSNLYKYIQLPFYNSTSSVLIMTSVLTGGVFQNYNNSNSGGNYGSFGSVSRVNMSHSAGTGTMVEVNYRIEGGNSGNVLTPTVIGTGTLSTSNISAIQSLQTVSSTFAFGGSGIIHTGNNVCVIWNTYSDRAGAFTGRHQYGQSYIGTNTAGEVFAYGLRSGGISGGTANITLTNNSGSAVTITAGGDWTATSLANGATQTFSNTNFFNSTDYNNRQQWSFTGASSAIADIAASGTGNATVQIADGGAGADGTVVIAINGSTFTVTNNNTNPINIVAGTGSANIGATSTASFTGSGTGWSYTGKKPTENSDNDPFSTAVAFSGTGVTNNSDGVPTGGIDTTNFTGEFSRTKT